MTAYNDEDENLMADRRPALDPKVLEATLQFNRIVDQVEARCVAVDGPVTPTLQEITEQELSDLWHAVQTIRAALPPSSAVVSSKWKLVPIEPTPEMIHAGGDAIRDEGVQIWPFRAGRTAYRAMLAAAPSPPALDGAARLRITPNPTGEQA